MHADIDPDYYDSENHGYWLLSPTYEWDKRHINESEVATREGRACWLPEYEPDIPF